MHTIDLFDQGHPMDHSGGGASPLTEKFRRVRAKMHEAENPTSEWLATLSDSDLGYLRNRCPPEDRYPLLIELLMAEGADPRDHLGARPVTSWTEIKFGIMCGLESLRRKGLVEFAGQLSQDKMTYLRITKRGMKLGSLLGRDFLDFHQEKQN